MTEIEPPRARLVWRTVTVESIREETPRVRTLFLDCLGWSGHLAGQHVDVRLTAEDGYQAQRSYSISSAPEDGLALTVERIEDGEVSSYLAGELQPGDKFEVRGPIGGFFVWRASQRPLFLVAGGSGVAPLMAMLRHRSHCGAAGPATLLYSSRTYDDIIYRDELDRYAAQDKRVCVLHTLTRSQPPGWTGATRRIDRDMLAKAPLKPADAPEIFICGSTSLVDSAALSLVDLGFDGAAIKTERFGPSGGPS